MRAWRTANASLGNRVTYFLYDEMSGQLQYELEPSGASYVLRNVYGFGAAGMARRLQPQDNNLLTTFAYDPSGNTVARSLSVGTAAIRIGAPWRGRPRCQSPCLGVGDEHADVALGPGRLQRRKRGALLELAV